MKKFRVLFFIVSLRPACCARTLVDLDFSGAARIVFDDESAVKDLALTGD